MDTQNAAFVERARAEASEAGLPGSGFTRRRLIRNALALAGGAQAASLLAARAQPRSQATPQPSRQAGGTITVYSGLNESTNNAFIEAFKEANPGFEVEALALAAAGQLQTRISTEKNSPKGDIFLGGSSEYHAPLAEEGLLEPYQSPNAATIEPAFKDPDGHWTGWYIGIIGLAINKDRWADEMGDRPKPATWDDLLSDDFRGKLVFPGVITTGAGYIFLATQVFRFGRDEDKAMDYMKKLHANIGQYTGTGPQTIELVGQGQFLMGPNWGHDILTAAEREQPVELLVPPDTGSEVGAVSIIKGGPNTEAAKVFVDWVLTKEAGKLNVELSNRLSVFEDVPAAEGAPTLDEAKLVDYDRAWATENKDRLSKKWQEVTGL